MVAIAGLALAAIGTGASLYGSSTSNEEKKRQAAYQSQAAQQDYAAQQEIFKAQQQIYGYQQENYGTLQGVNTEISRGQDIQRQGQEAAVAAQKGVIGEEEKMNQQRELAMNLDATRRTRETVRQFIANRSLALSTATQQGAQGGSGLQGAYGQASGRTSVNLLGISQNTEIGASLFALQRNITGLKYGLADAQSLANQGQSVINQAESTAKGSANLLASRTAAAQSAGQAAANQYTTLGNQARMQGNIAQTSANSAAALAGTGGTITSLGGALVQNQSQLNSLYKNYSTPSSTPTSTSNYNNPNSYFYWA